MRTPAHPPVKQDESLQTDANANADWTGGAAQGAGLQRARVKRVAGRRTTLPLPYPAHTQKSSRTYVATESPLQTTTTISKQYTNRADR